MAFKSSKGRNTGKEAEEVEVLSASVQQVVQKQHLVMVLSIIPLHLHLELIPFQLHQQAQKLLVETILKL